MEQQQSIESILFRLSWVPKKDHLISYQSFQRIEKRKILEVLGDNQLLTDVGVFWEHEVHWFPKIQDLQELIQKYPVRFGKVTKKRAEVVYKKQFIEATGEDLRQTLINLFRKIHGVAVQTPELSKIESEEIFVNLNHTKEM
jgi:hypothetical protein